MTGPDSIRGAAATCRGAAPGPEDAVAALQSALASGDEDWTYAVALEVRDRLREALDSRRDDPAAPRAALASWAVCPAGFEGKWHVLMAALVSHEFKNAGLPAPGWTLAPRLGEAWVLDTPRLTDEQIKEQTPPWLRARNIFIAEKDLITL